MNGNSRIDLCKCVWTASRFGRLYLGQGTFWRLMNWTGVDSVAILTFLQIKCHALICNRTKINTSQQDFGTRKGYCVSNVTFHSESKYAIKIFHHSQFLYNGLFNYWFFGIFGIFISDFFYTWTNILNGFEHRVVTYNLPLSYLQLYVVRHRKWTR